MAKRINKPRPADKFFSIYTVTHRASGKVYVGATYRLAKRWYQHKKCDGYCSGLYAAIKEHGVEAFDFEVIAMAKTREDALSCEASLIADRNTKSPNGYNLTDGGIGGYGMLFTDETLAKMSAVRKGKVMSDEQKALLRIASTGKKLSAEAREKVAASKRGRKYPPEFGRRVSEGKKGKPAWNKGMRRIDGHYLPIGEAACVQ